MADRRPGRGRYAALEREQRWVVGDAPPATSAVTTITDRYIRGTGLRLRRSDSDDGVVYKLGQKVRDDPADPETVRLTNLYLSVEEYRILYELPAAELRKTRSHVMWADHVLAVDRFLDRLDGLVLAEVELTSEEAHLPPPPWTTRDVTSEDRFSGGTLACAGDDEIAALLREVASN